jgi:uncharacterized YigZ family protein
MRTPSPDDRIVPAGPGRGEVREKASRFFAFAHPVSSAEEAARIVEDLEREYHDATHVAFAWKIGTGPSASERSSDAGEPSGTAGKPIAAAIASAGVADVVVAVVRYFGGTKLGTGGLVRAYREAADKALAAAGRRTVREVVRVTVTCTYENLGAARRLVRPPDVTLAGETFDPDPVLNFEVVASRLQGLLASLSEARLSFELEHPSRVTDS